jgi:uncharacterized protein YbbC (DUF1343 family)
MILAMATALMVSFASEATDDFAITTSPPEAVGLNPAKLAEIDQAVTDAIERGELPGAVVVVLREGKQAYRKAIGARRLVPDRQPMTLDTPFDVASLTKPIATAMSILCLVDDGKLQLSDSAAQVIPEFAQNGKAAITIEQLLLHTSGLEADNPLTDYSGKPDEIMARIYALKPIAPPGSRFIYSDVGYIVLGEIVSRLSGRPLNTFARERVFAPLGMTHTTFQLDADRAKAAPLDRRDGEIIQGVVHDPRAFRLGGVAGHAGLFSTADDLALFAQMLLDEGESRSRRVFSRDLIRAMTRPREVPGGRRALGWDVDTRFSAHRGKRFSKQGLGHTGFTGASIWVDPPSRMAVIFLSNRLHPDGKGNVQRLRGIVATIAAESIARPPFSVDTPAAPSGVSTGIDVLARDGFQALQGRRIGLVTNHTGMDRRGRRTIDLLHTASGVKLVALFSPEHGIAGSQDDAVADQRDEKTGLPVYSLYGKRKRPDLKQLDGIDTLVFDIQDIGCRFYTYISTLGYLLETAAERNLKVVVLDRPNPLGGLAVEGPVLADPKLESFTAYHKLPIRHGMTVGELAQMFNSERNIGAELEVVRMANWRRGDYFDQTGLEWIHPSPNMRSLTAALLYPGVGLLEMTNVSVGRGTDRPFEILGAPWIDGPLLARTLTADRIPGIRVVGTRFTPTSSTFARKTCGGVQVFVDDWRAFCAVRAGIHIACHLKRLYPHDWQDKRYEVLLAHAPTMEAIRRGAAPAAIVELWNADLDAFRAARARFLIYD